MGTMPAPVKAAITATCLSCAIRAARRKPAKCVLSGKLEWITFDIPKPSRVQIERKSRSLGFHRISAIPARLSPRRAGGGAVRVSLQAATEVARSDLDG